MRPNDRGSEQGSALILVMLMAVILGLLTVAMFSSVLSRSRMETFGDDSVFRFYSAEAGLSRARYMVSRHTDELAGQNWLKL